MGQSARPSTSGVSAGHLVPAASTYALKRGRCPAPPSAGWQRRRQRQRAGGGLEGSTRAEALAEIIGSQLQLQCVSSRALLIYRPQGTITPCARTALCQHKCRPCVRLQAHPPPPPKYTNHEGRPDQPVRRHRGAGVAVVPVPQRKAGQVGAAGDGGRRWRRWPHGWPAPLHMLRLYCCRVRGWCSCGGGCGCCGSWGALPATCMAPLLPPELPLPLPVQVLVKSVSVGVNPVDLIVRSGFYMPASFPKVRLLCSPYLASCSSARRRPATTARSAASAGGS